MSTTKRMYLQHEMEIYPRIIGGSGERTQAKPGAIRESTPARLHITVVLVGCASLCGLTQRRPAVVIRDGCIIAASRCLHVADLRALNLRALSLRAVGLRTSGLTTRLAVCSHGWSLDAVCTRTAVLVVRTRTVVVTVLAPHDVLRIRCGGQECLPGQQLLEERPCRRNGIEKVGCRIWEIVEHVHPGRRRARIGRHGQREVCREQGVAARVTSDRLAREADKELSSGEKDRARSLGIRSGARHRDVDHTVAIGACVHAGPIDNGCRGHRVPDRARGERHDTRALRPATCAIGNNNGAMKDLHRVRGAPDDKLWCVNGAMRGRHAGDVAIAVVRGCGLGREHVGAAVDGTEAAESLDDLANTVHRCDKGGRAVHAE
eukprot:m.14066 g.14066  ORF g.14066 m.14066 type:complete len:376 (+) comp2897_c0_seq1:1073-2200(+)